jgi:hypothetical protein
MHISSVTSGSATVGMDVDSEILMRGSHNRPRDWYKRGKVRRHKMRKLSGERGKTAEFKDPCQRECPGRKRSGVYCATYGMRHKAAKINNAFVTVCKCLEESPSYLRAKRQRQVNPDRMRHVQ